MNKKSLFIAASLMLLCKSSYCAEPDKVILDIRQVLELVEDNNKDVATARRSVATSQQDIEVAKAAKLPDITASLSINYLGDVTITDRDFSNAFAAHVPHLGNSIGFSVYQPVYAGGAINAGIAMANAGNKLSATALEQTRQDISMQAISCFLELFKTSNLLNVYDENIANTEKVLTEMRARHQEGVVLKNDITRYELRLSTLNYDRLTLSNRISVLNNDLCILLGLPSSTIIETNINDELNALPSITSKADWYDTSLANSLSLKMIDIKKEINEQQRKALKAEYLPHVGLVAGDSFSGPITFEIPALNNNYNYWFVGVSVDYNVSSLFKTPKSVQKNRLELEELNSSREAVTEHLDRVIDDTYTQYTQAFKMLETEQKNVELATENYQIVENRYNNQLALLTDMLDASTAKLDAEVRLVNARVNIIYYYYLLKQNSGTLL
jgi:outer membrane protein TolC